MPTYNPPLPKAPQPTKVFFDPYNSSSTGHQRAENRLSGSTSWRDSRTYKLKHQFSDTSGRGGQSHLSDLVGAGSETFGKDGRKENGDWEKGAPGLRDSGWQDIRGLLGGEKKRKSPSTTTEDVAPSLKRQRSNETQTSRHSDDRPKADHNESSSSSAIDSPPFTSAQPPPPPDSSQDTTHASSQLVNEPAIDNPLPLPPPPIFRGLTIYLNGSTAPLVSDHHLKQLFFQHGGAASISLGRRTVTHVIVGSGADGGGGGGGGGGGAGAGAGLAGTKIQKEIANVRGKGVKFVTAQWVLDSVEKGVRQAEGRYVPRSLGGRMGGAGQGSVRELFRVTEKEPESG